MSDDADLKRDRRQEAAEDGFCVTCTTRRPEPGYRTCVACLDSVARAKRKMIGRVEGGWCLECIAYGFHRAGCPNMLKKGAR